MGVQRFFRIQPQRCEFVSVFFLFFISVKKGNRKSFGRDRTRPPSHPVDAKGHPPPPPNPSVPLRSLLFSLSCTSALPTPFSSLRGVVVSFRNLDDTLRGGRGSNPPPLEFAGGVRGPFPPLSPPSIPAPECPVLLPLPRDHWIHGRGLAQGWRPGPPPSGGCRKPRREVDRKVGKVVREGESQTTTPPSWG